MNVQGSVPDRAHPGARPAPLEGDELRERVLAWARAASSEISPHDEPLLPQLARALPPGTGLYVAHTPKATLEDVVRVALAVQSLGLAACPHIVARRLPDRAALQRALAALRAAGISQVLLVGGDLSEPLGPFASTLQVLQGGDLEREGFERAGVAGHPEGHPVVDPATLWQALADKQAFAARGRLQLHIVTQFSFQPAAVCAWAASLPGRGIRLPVHVGMAGPTPLPKLIRFAMQCGVGASLRTLGRNFSVVNKMSRLAASPDDMLVALVRGCAEQGASLVRQPHIFSFGGAMAAAQWLTRLREGTIDFPARPRD